VKKLWRQRMDKPVTGGNPVTQLGIMTIAGACALLLAVSTLATYGGLAEAASPRALKVTVASANRSTISDVWCELNATGTSAITTGNVVKKGLGSLTISLAVYDAQGAMLNLAGFTHTVTVASGTRHWQVQAQIVNGFHPTRCVIDVATTQELKNFYVPSAAMTPTIKAGDRVTVDLSAYDTSIPRRGDIVVFRRPPAENCGGAPVPDLVKRVIGLPGNTISARGGKVYIDGKELPEPWLPKVSSTYTSTFGPIQVPKGDYFMMGDNRIDSCDSRDWGPLPGSYIVGKVVKVIPGSSSTAAALTPTQTTTNPATSTSTSTGTTTPTTNPGT
jgi:signal peptidase I